MNCNDSLSVLAGYPSCNTFPSTSTADIPFLAILLEIAFIPLSIIPVTGPAIEPTPRPIRAEFLAFWILSGESQSPVPVPYPYSPMSRAPAVPPSVALLIRFWNHCPSLILPTYGRYLPSLAITIPGTINAPAISAIAAEPGFSSTYSPISLVTFFISSS